MLKKITALAAAVIMTAAVNPIYAKQPSADGSMQATAGSYASAESGGRAAARGYTAVAENRNYRLLADLVTGDFALEELKTGKLWYSGQWDVLDDSHPASELNSGRIKTDLVSSVANI